MIYEFEFDAGEDVTLAVHGENGYPDAINKVKFFGSLLGADYDDFPCTFDYEGQSLDTILTQTVSTKKSDAENEGDTGYYSTDSKTGFRFYQVEYYNGKWGAIATANTHKMIWWKSTGDHTNNPLELGDWTVTTADGNEYDGSWTNQDVTVSIPLGGREEWWKDKSQSTSQWVYYYDAPVVNDSVKEFSTKAESDNTTVSRTFSENTNIGILCFELGDATLEFLPYARNAGYAPYVSEAALSSIKIDKDAPDGDLKLTSTEIVGPDTGVEIKLTLNNEKSGKTSPVWYCFDKNLQAPEFSTSTWTEYKIGRDNSYIARSSGQWYCYLRDEAGNTASLSITVMEVDNCPPTIDFVTLDPSGYCQSTDICIAAEDTSGGYDNPSGLHDYAYAMTVTETDTKTWQKSSQFTVTKNGTYYIWVRDKVGNVAETSVTVTNVDTTKPTVSASWTGSGTSKTHTNGKVTISMTISDAGGSGLYGYTVTESSTEPTSWTTQTAAGTYTVNKTITANTTFYCWVKDNAGNTAYKTISPKYDNTKPTVSQLEAEAPGWTNQNVTLTAVGVLDNASGIAGYYFTTENLTTAPAASDNNWQSNNTRDGVTTYGTWYVWVKDGAGNVSANPASVTVYYDALAPVFDKVEWNTDWTNQSVTLTASAYDPDAANGARKSGISGYYWSDSESNFPAVGECTESNTYNVDENGTYYCWVGDKAGNITGPYVCEVTNIDTDMPTATVTLSNYDWTNETVEITISGTDEGSSGLYGYYYAKSEEPTPTKDMFTPFKEGETSATLEMKKYGTYYCWVCDNAGNVSLENGPITVKYDGIAPYIGELSVSSTGWTNKTIEITGTYPWNYESREETESRIVGVYYSQTDLKKGKAALSPSDFDAAVQKGTAQKGECGLNSIDGYYEISCKVAANGTWYLWLVDKAGNVSATYDVTVQYDAKDPEIKITAAPPNYVSHYGDGEAPPESDDIVIIGDNIWTKGDVVLTASAKDEEGDGSGASGIVGYCWTQQTKEPTAASQFSLKDTVRTVAENNTTWYCWTRDEAGNQAKDSYMVIHMDKTAPTYQLEQTKFGEYEYTKQITLTILKLLKAVMNCMT